MDKMDNNSVYKERNDLVCVLSKIFPAWLGKHDGEDWDDEWRNIVYIETPNGQASWHIKDRELENFSHLTLDDTKSYDGHSTEEKYDRLRALPQYKTTIGSK